MHPVGCDCPACQWRGSGALGDVLKEYIYQKRERTKAESRAQSWADLMYGIDDEPEGEPVEPEEVVPITAEEARRIALQDLGMDEQ